MANIIEEIESDNQRMEALKGDAFLTLFDSIEVDIDYRGKQQV